MRVLKEPIKSRDKVSEYLFWAWGVKNLPFSDARFLIVTPLYQLSRCGNMLFFMITAWFSKDVIDNRKIFGKLKKLHHKLLFYSLGILIILYFCGVGFEALQWVKAFLPVCSNYYWFITTYFIFIIILPFINLLVEQLDVKNCLMVIWAVVIYQILTGDTVLPDCIIVGMVTVFIRNNFTSFKKFTVIQYLIGYVLFSFIGAVFDLLAYKFEFMNTDQPNMLGHFAYLLGGGCLFFAILISGRANNKFIDTFGKGCSSLSPYILGVYLISVHPVLAKQIYEIISKYMPQNVVLFIVYFALCTVGITIGCCFIDFVLFKIICFIKDSLRIREKV